VDLWKAWRGSNVKLTGSKRRVSIHLAYYIHNFNVEAKDIIDFATTGDKPPSFTTYSQILANTMRLQIPL